MSIYLKSNFNEHRNFFSNSSTINQNNFLMLMTENEMLRSLKKNYKKYQDFSYSLNSFPLKFALKLFTYD